MTEQASSKKHADKTTSTTANKNRYTGFYLTMLILSTCIAAFNGSSFIDIPKYLGFFTQEPFFVSFMLVDFLAMIVALVGLILLFKKQHLGLVLTLGSLAAQAILAIVMLFFVEQLIAFSIASMNPADLPAPADKDSYATFTRAAMYAVIPIGVVSSLAIAVLWHFAWHKQYRSDHPSKK